MDVNELHSRLSKANTCHQQGSGSSLTRKGGSLAFRIIVNSIPKSLARAPPRVVPVAIRPAGCTHGLSSVARVRHPRSKQKCRQMHTRCTQGAGQLARPTRCIAQGFVQLLAASRSLPRQSGLGAIPPQSADPADYFEDSFVCVARLGHQSSGSRNGDQKRTFSSSSARRLHLRRLPESGN